MGTILFGEVVELEPQICCDVRHSLRTSEKCIKKNCYEEKIKSLHVYHPWAAFELQVSIVGVKLIILLE